MNSTIVKIATLASLMAGPAPIKPTDDFGQKWAPVDHSSGASEIGKGTFVKIVDPSQESDTESMRSSYFAALQKIGVKQFSPGNWLFEANEKLDTLSALEDDWDGYGSEAPTHGAISKMMATLSHLESAGITPSKLKASAAGGVELSVRINGHYFAIESLNTGTLLYELDGEIGPLPADDVEHLASFLTEVRSVLGTRC